MEHKLTSKNRLWAMHGAASLAVALGAVAAPDAARAQSSFYAYTASCQANCIYGATSFWTPPSGNSAVSSVSHSWAYIATGGSDPSSNFSAGAGAQASISGPNKWSASSSASGYFNSSGLYNGNGVSGTGIILMREELTVPGTPNWNGPGWLRLSYRITGAVAVNYAETSSTSGLTLGSAQSSISFECGSARVNGIGSSRCESADFAPPQAGDLNLYGRLDYNASQTVDRVVSFNVRVASDVLYAYRLQTSVSSRLTMNATNRTGQLDGGTAADFSHTFTLIDAQLFDNGFNEVPQWSATSASGFDYAHIAAVPEPGSAALFAAGVALLGWKLRRSSVRATAA